MPDLSRRAVEDELLDTGVPEHEALGSLADLRFVNRWLGNRRAFARAVRAVLDGVPAPVVLDAGCGSADVTSYLREALGPSARAVGFDLKLLHLREAPPDVLRVAGDVRSLPFAPRSFDVVTACQFLHHFAAPDLPAVLSGLWACARRALVVNDLRRARVPYTFGRVAFPVILRSRVSRSDGLVSIRAGFHEDELREAFRAAGLPEPRIERTWPYRLLAVAERPRH